MMTKMQKSTLHFPTKQMPVSEAPAPDVEYAINHIVDLVREGLAHGFFHLEIRGTIGSGKRRELVVSSGKSHKFNISSNDLEI